MGGDDLVAPPRPDSEIADQSGVPTEGPHRGRVKPTPAQLDINQVLGIDKGEDEDGHISESEVNDPPLPPDRRMSEPETPPPPGKALAEDDMADEDAPPPPVAPGHRRMDSEDAPPPPSGARDGSAAVVLAADEPDDPAPPPAGGPRPNGNPDSKVSGVASLPGSNMGFEDDLAQELEKETRLRKTQIDAMLQAEENKEMLQQVVLDQKAMKELLTRIAEEQSKAITKQQMETDYLKRQADETSERLAKYNNDFGMTPDEQRLCRACNCSIM